MTQKRLGEAQIAELISKAGLDLPFSQVEAAKGAFVAPQTGGELASIYGKLMQGLAPLYEVASNTAQAPSNVATQYLGQLADFIVSQIQAGKGLTETAQSLFYPAQETTALSDALARALGTYGQTQYAGISNVANVLQNMLNTGYTQQQQGFANLLEQYTNMPNQLFGTAFEQYGNIGALMAKLLTDQYIAKLNASTQQNIASDSADVC